TASWRSICSGVSSSKKPASKLAALLTSTSMPPKRSTAALTAASASWVLVTSSLTASKFSASPTALCNRVGVVGARNRAMATRIPEILDPGLQHPLERHQPDERKRREENEPEGVEGGADPARGRINPSATRPPDTAASNVDARQLA